jgi:acyl-lipid omega-6 desaturase (Delta-12 desaturase)
VSSENGKIKVSQWKTLVAKYQTSEYSKSIWQFVNSFVPFCLTWVLMYYSLDISYFLTLLLSLFASGFIMRIFIIQHDCGHGSFFPTRKANDYLGMFCSVLTFTPYHYWRKSHAIHHAAVGKLDERGIGDVKTLTVDEYLARNKWGRFRYRLYRNPLILFMVIPPALFLFLYRFPISKVAAMKNLHTTVYITNLAIALIAGIIIVFIGVKAFLLIQVPIIIFSLCVGTWFFYVQHQFEETYWKEEEEWDYTEAALKGSSYYKLPRVLQWFTGNIGFHHIHHLSPRIPNYKLEKCHRENPLLQSGAVLTLRTSLKSMYLNLWDKNRKKLISFGDLKKLGYYNEPVG